MKKIFTLLASIAAFFAMQSFVVPANEHPSIHIGLLGSANPFGMSLQKFTELSTKEFSTITGKKMNFFKRIEFRAMQHRIKHDLKKHPDATWGNYVKFNSKGEASFSFNWGAFALGFLLWPIGVLIALLAFEDKQAWKSALIGLGVGILFGLLVLRSLFLAVK